MRSTAFINTTIDVIKERGKVLYILYFATVVTTSGQVVATEIEKFCNCACVQTKENFQIQQLKLQQSPLVDIQIVPKLAILACNDQKLGKINYLSSTNYRLYF